MALFLKVTILKKMNSKIIKKEVLCCPKKVDNERGFCGKRLFRDWDELWCVDHGHTYKEPKKGILHVITTDFSVTSG